MSNSVDKDKDQLNEKDTNLSVSEEKKNEEIKGEKETINEENKTENKPEEKKEEKQENKEQENKENHEKENEDKSFSDDEIKEESKKEKTPEEKREELKSRLSSGMRMQFKEGKGKFSFKGFVMLIFVLTVLLSLPTMLADVEKTPSKEVSYTEFIKMSENKQIAKVEEKEGYVYGFIGEGENLKSFKTRMITDRLGSDPNLVKVLETEPFGYTEQDMFLNACIEIKTLFTPQELLEKLLNIELEMGRVRTIKWGPRIIDIDILFFDDEIIQDKNLAVPHPWISERMFVLEPLCEIAPNLIHPLERKPVATLKRILEKELEK